MGDLDLTGSFDKLAAIAAFQFSASCLLVPIKIRISFPPFLI
jgi:hypothetical protein